MTAQPDRDTVAGATAGALASLFSVATVTSGFYLVLVVGVTAAVVVAAVRSARGGSGVTPWLSTVLTVLGIVAADVVAYFLAGSLAGLPAAGWAAAAVVGSGSGLAVLEWWWRAPLGDLPNPAAAQIWWADVPFEEGRGSKDRPCLVLSGTGRSRQVLMFTSQDKSGRKNYLEMPSGTWRTATRSYLRTDRVIRVRCEKFRRLEGPGDQATLNEVTRRLGRRAQFDSAPVTPAGPRTRR